MALTSLQVVSVPVSDQDRAKQFYVGQLGFAEEIDASFGDSMRWVMLRPPGSGTAVTLVTWFESASRTRHLRGRLRPYLLTVRRITVIS